MKEKLKEFVAAKRAVSPVIGVVLMVAVVVILAAVIGAFVLGLGGSQSTAPQASFSYDSDSGTLTMEAGETINPDAITIFTEKGEETGVTWDGNITAGSSVDIGTEHSSIRVVWDSPNSDKTATIWESA